MSIVIFLLLKLPELQHCDFSPPEFSALPMYKFLWQSFALLDSPIQGVKDFCFVPGWTFYNVYNVILYSASFCDLALCVNLIILCFFFSSRSRHTRLQGDWSSDVCSSDLAAMISCCVRPNSFRADLSLIVA